MILKLGIATVALTGGVLLVKGEIDILTFFVFLLLVSRMYDPPAGGTAESGSYYQYQCAV